MSSSAPHTPPGDWITHSIDILLREYDSLRNEIVSHSNTRTQIWATSAVLVVGVLAFTPFAFSADAGRVELRIPIVAAAFVLFILSCIFSTLALAMLLSDFEVGNIATRIKSIRSTLMKVVDPNGEPSKGVVISEYLAWDKDHMKMLVPASRRDLIGSFVMSGARYGLMLIPSLIALLAGFYSATKIESISSGVLLGTFGLVDTVFLLSFAFASRLSFRAYPSYSDEGGRTS